MSDFIETKEHRHWCQNSKCADKQTQNQLRGTKGHKYYQSNKASGYYVYWCSTGCRESWWNEHKDTCIRVVGLRLKPAKVMAENAWQKDYQYNYNHKTQRSDNIHYLKNVLLGERIPITEAQYNALGWNDTDGCNTLANQLRSQVKQSA
jgi:hypothetical protein